MHQPHRRPRGAALKIADDARMALPLIRDMMLLKQKS
jgi:hypothetical protein